MSEVLVDLGLGPVLPKLLPGDVGITHASHGLAPYFGDGDLANEIPQDDNRHLVASPEELVGELLTEARLLAATTMSRGSPLRTPIFSLCLMLLPPCLRREKCPSRYLAKKKPF